MILFGGFSLFSIVCWFAKAISHDAFFDLFNYLIDFPLICFKSFFLKPLFKIFQNHFFQELTVDMQ